MRVNYPMLRRSHPLAKDVVWGCAMGHLHDVVTGRVATVEADHTIGTPNYWGRSITKTTANSSNGVYWPGCEPIRRITRNCTLVFFGTITTVASAYNSLIKVPYRTDGTWSTPYQSLDLAGGAGNEGVIDYAQNSSTGVSSGLASGFYTGATGDWHSWIGVRGGDGSSALFYRDGALFSSQTFGTNADIDFSGSVPEVNLMLSSQSANIANAPAASCALALIISRDLTAGEIRALHRDPWALFREPKVFLVSTRAAAAAGAMAAVARGEGTVTGALSSSAYLSGTAHGLGTVTSSMTVSAPMAGTATGTGVVTTALTVRDPLAAAPYGYGHVVAALTATVSDGSMAATATGTGVVVSGLTVDAPLAATATGTGVVVTGLTVDDYLAGTAHGSANLTAALDVDDYLAGACSGTGTVIVSISSKSPLAGPATGTGTMAGSITVTALPGEVSGACVGSATVNASLNALFYDNDEIVVTARTDCEGDTIRPPRLWHRLAFDSAMRSALHGAHRLPMDRHAVRASLTGRSVAQGTVTVLAWDAGRAGDAWSPERIWHEYGVDMGAGRLYTTTTGGLDCEGNSVIPSALMAFLASDSALRSDLATVGVTDQDRFCARLALPSAQGEGSRYALGLDGDGRAGSVWSPRRVRVEYGMVGTTPTRAKAT